MIVVIGEMVVMSKFAGICRNSSRLSEYARFSGICLNLWEYVRISRKRRNLSEYVENGGIFSQYHDLPEYLAICWNMLEFVGVV